MHIRLNHTNATMLMVSIVVALLFVLNYSAAQWTPAPANPPSNNVAAPINVGNAEQTKAGVLGVGGLGVNGNSVFSGSYIDYSFVRTGGSGNEPSKWRIRRNDGTTNWASYLNTDGGTSPTLYASGNAFRQSYMPGSGIYSFEVSNTSGPAGATFSWNPAMRINPNGNVTIYNDLCDSNGNCTNAGDVVTGGGGGLKLGDSISGGDLPAVTQSVVDTYCAYDVDPNTARPTIGFKNEDSLAVLYGIVGGCSTPGSQACWSDYSYSCVLSYDGATWATESNDFQYTPYGGEY